MTTEKKGRPAHLPDDSTRQAVEVLTGSGMTQDRIAAVLKISEPTLRLHYTEEIKNGLAKVEAHFVNNLFRLSKGNGGVALRATQFFLQCRCGWSEYAPRPVEAKEEKLGKKELANRDAQTAHEDDPEWADLIH